MPLLGLDSNGYKLPAIKLGTDLVKMAKKYVGKSKYVFGAKDNDAPDIVDCASFAKWLYKQFGYELSRPSDYMAEKYGIAVSPSKLIAGDLIYYATDGVRRDRYKNITHVAIYDGNGRYCTRR